MDRKFLVSSDSSGVLGRPKQWNEAWNFVKSDSSFGGYEKMAWGGLFPQYTNLLLKDARRRDINVVGLHGQTGGIHERKNLSGKIILGGLNRIIILVDRLIEAGGKSDYILLHAPKFREEGVLEKVVSNRQKIKKVFVENHPEPGGVNAAVGVARELRERGVNAGIMFDIFHDFERRLQTDSTETAFKKTLQVVEETSQQKGTDRQIIPLSVHIAVGTNKKDSLPFSCINQCMWSEVSNVLRDVPGAHVVIENQQEGMGAVLPWKLEK